MVSITEITASSILVPQRAGSLSGGYDYSINPYAGCAFSCSYCYVPKFPNGNHHFSEWGQWVHVKTNAPELIRKERTKVFGSRIFFSSATDPYQYLELKYRLSRRCLEELLLYKPHKLTLHTRSHLMLQDLDLIKSFGSVVQVGVSFTTDDETVRRQFEPTAPSLSRRLELIRELHKAGVKVYVSMAPLLPCNPNRLIELVKPYVKKVWVGQMSYPEINNKPELLKEYAEFFEPNNYRKVVQKIASSFNSSFMDEPRKVTKKELAVLSSYKAQPVRVSEISVAPSSQFLQAQLKLSL